MKALMIVFSIIWIISGCSHDQNTDFGEPDFCNDISCEFTISDNSQIEFNDGDRNASIDIRDGSNLVFHMSTYDDGFENIIDDEVAEQIYFEVDKTGSDQTSEVSSFNMDVSKQNAYYGRFCFCGVTGFFPITNGSISGERLNNNQWMVQVDIEVIHNNESYANYDFTAIYMMK